MRITEYVVYVPNCKTRICISYFKNVRKKQCLKHLEMNSCLSHHHQPHSYHNSESYLKNDFRSFKKTFFPLINHTLV